jgi:glycerophosphoryl diester phosphodiesterase
MKVYYLAGAACDYGPSRGVEQTGEGARGDVQRRTRWAPHTAQDEMTTQIVASECCAGLFPANSRSGFLYCIEHAIDGIEFDVQLSADGHVVVHHDYLLNPRVTRTASGTWIDAPGPAICRLTLDELQTFDIGRYHPHSKEHATYPDCIARDGERIPALRDLLADYRHNTGTATLWIELKSSPYQRQISADPRELTRQVIEELVSNGLERNTVLLAFEWDLLRFARDLCPAITTDFLSLNPAHVIALNRRVGPIDPYLLYGAFDPRRYANDVSTAIAAAGGDWWGPYSDDVTAADVTSAQRRGLRVNLWGVESSDAAMTRALALRADAITLSHPDLLAAKIRIAR